MSPTETELLRLALLAYEAAAEPTLWPRFLELYNDAIASDISLLQVHDIALNRSSIVSAFGMSSPLKQSYDEHYSKLNVWRQRGRALYVPGMVNLDQEQYPRPVFERSEFYNDYLRSIDAAYIMGAIIARREDQTPTLTALRGRRKGEFSAEERAAAKFLLPHLRRAWTVYEKLELLIAGESVLDGLPLGIVFLVAGGVAVYANQCANDIFRANDGLSLRNGKPCAWDRRADASLNKSLKHASSPGRQTGPPAVGVPRVSGRRAYQVAIAPLRARFPQFTGAPGPMAVVFITDPERERPAKLDLLIQLFGLTRKEAEMAAKLSGAKSIEQVAEEMGITYGTVTFLNGNRVTFQTRESAFRGNALFNIIPGINLGATPASRYVQDGAAWTMPFDAISVSNLNNTNSITGTVTLQDSDGHAVATASIPSIPPGGAAGYLLIGRAPGDSLGLFPSSTTLPAGDDGIFHRILVVGLTGLTPTGQSFVLAQEYNGNSMLNLPVFGSPVP